VLFIHILDFGTFLAARCSSHRYDVSRGGWFVLPFMFTQAYFGRNYVKLSAELK